MRKRKKTTATRRARARARSTKGQTRARQDEHEHMERKEDKKGDAAQQLSRLCCTARCRVTLVSIHVRVLCLYVCGVKYTVHSRVSPHSQRSLMS